MTGPRSLEITFHLSRGVHRVIQICFHVYPFSQPHVYVYMLFLARFFSFRYFPPYIYPLIQFGLVGGSTLKLLLENCVDTK